MSHFSAVPPWAAVVIALLVVSGSTAALIGSLGLYRIRSFYERLHAPTLGTSGGTAGIVLASMALFSVLGLRPVVHEILILIFITMTTPVTLILLGKAALHRDRREERADVPAAARGEPAEVADGR